MQTNSKNWIRFFQKHCAYKPVQALRKDKGCLGKIDFRLGLDLFAEFANHQPIFLVFPFGKEGRISDCVAVFPQRVYTGTDIFYVIEDFIFYDGQTYAPTDFIKKVAPLKTSFDIDFYDPHVISLSLLLLTSKEFNNFKSLYLNPIREKIIKSEFYPDSRGNREISSDTQLVRDFVLREYRKRGSPKRIPITSIMFSYDRFLRTLTVERADALRRDEATIRRIIQSYINK